MKDSKLFSNRPATFGDKHQNYFLPIVNQLVILLVFFFSGAYGQSVPLMDKSIVHLEFETSGLINQQNADNGNKLTNFHAFNTSSDKTPDTLFDLRQYQQASLFLVYRSEKTTESNIARLTESTGTTAFSTHTIYKQSNSSPEKIESGNGIIVSYELSDSEIKTQRYLSIKDYVEMSGSSGNQLLELILFPFMLNDEERNVVESYLSIKYGISLSPNSDYRNSSQTLIWNSKENSQYSLRVTGIGRDDENELYQKQSQNESFKKLAIAIGSAFATNQLNDSRFDNQSFMLWGDNDGELRFTPDSLTTLETLRRQWKVQVTGSADTPQVNYQVMINGFGLAATKDSVIWMVVYDSLTGFIGGTYYEGVPKGDSCLFNNVSFNQNPSDSVSFYYFTFMRTPLLSAIVTSDRDGCRCPDMGNIHIRTLRGAAPFTYSIKSDDFSDHIRTYQSGNSFYNLEPGKYEISVTDSLGNIYSAVQIIRNSPDNPVTLPEKVTLQSGEPVMISPVFLKDNAEFYRAEWFSSDQFITDQQTLTTNQPGKYTLVLTDSRGCTKRLKTTIIDQPSDDTGLAFSVHPNPVKTGNPFIIELHLKDEAPGTIEITDAVGKLVERFTSSGDSKITHRLYTPGVYIIKIRMTDTNYSAKLIVF